MRCIERNLKQSACQMGISNQLLEQGSVSLVQQPPPAEKGVEPPHCPMTRERGGEKHGLNTFEELMSSTTFHLWVIEGGTMRINEWPSDN